MPAGIILEDYNKGNNNKNLLHIHIAYIMHYYHETMQQWQRRLWQMAVTVAVTSCDAVESECNLSFCDLATAKSIPSKSELTENL